MYQNRSPLNDSLGCPFDSQMYPVGRQFTWHGAVSTTTNVGILSSEQFLGTKGKRVIFQIELTQKQAPDWVNTEAGCLQAAQRFGLGISGVFCAKKTKQISCRKLTFALTIFLICSLAFALSVPHLHSDCVHVVRTGARFAPVFISISIRISIRFSISISTRAHQHYH